MIRRGVAGQVTLKDLGQNRSSMPPVTTAESQEASAAAILKERRFKLSRQVPPILPLPQNTHSRAEPATVAGELFIVRNFSVWG